MSGRREFFAKAGLAAAGIFVRLPAPPSDPLVPRSFDCRWVTQPCSPIQLEVRRNGIPMQRVVAYDLDADMAVIAHGSERGYLNETVTGGITAHWRNE